MKHQLGRSPPLVVLLMTGLCGCLRFGGAQAVEACTTVEHRIYSVEGRLFNGMVTACSSGNLTDITQGANSPKPGEIAFVNIGKQQYGMEIILRGLPNHPYVVHAAEPYGKSYVPLTPRDGETWANASSTLPFVPREVYEIDMPKTGGWTWYAYGNIVNLRENDPNSYPLNSMSVIVAVDGYMFPQRDSWLGYVNNYKRDHAPSYADVVYLQRDERPFVLRRAFIPIYYIKDVAMEWYNATHQYALLSDNINPTDSTNLVTDAIMAIGILGLLMNGDSTSSPHGGSCDYLCQSEQIQRNLRQGQQ